MSIKIKHLLILLFIALIAFTCAEAAINTSEGEQQTIPTGSVFFSEKLINLLYGNLEVSKANFTADNNAPSFNLPSSLRIIDDSAFEGTALVSVDIPESVTYIGDNAFANIPTLLAVQIPDATEFIGNNAFGNRKNVTITTSSNSYARTWAKDNGFRFRLLATFSASNGVVSYSFQSDHGLRSSQKERAKTTDTSNTNIRERRTGRTVGELKASRYKGVAALHIQSRYFP